MKEFEEKVQKASERYLEHRGYEIIESKWESPEGTGTIDIIAKDEDGTIAFIDVEATKEKTSFPEAHFTRENAETLAAEYLKDAPADVIDCCIRFDVLAMVVLGSDRALIRHHINCLGPACDLLEDE